MGKKELALLAVSLCWGTTFGLGKYALAYMAVPTYLAWRFCTASLIILLFYWREIFSSSKREVILSSLFGLSVGMSYVTQSLGLTYTTASKNAFICGLYVVLVPYFARLFFKEKITKQAVFSAFLASIGLGCISLTGYNDFNFCFGDFLTLLSAVFAAMQIVSIGHFAKEISAVRIAFFQMLVIAILSFIWSLGIGDFGYHYPMPVWYTIIFLALFATAGAFMVQGWAQRGVKQSTVAIIFSLESVFGAIFACLFLHEPFTIKMLIGLVLLLAATLLSQKESEGEKDAISEGVS